MAAIDLIFFDFLCTAANAANATPKWAAASELTLHGYANASCADYQQSDKRAADVEGNKINFLCIYAQKRKASRKEKPPNVRVMRMNRGNTCINQTLSIEMQLQELELALLQPSMRKSARIASSLAQGLVAFDSS